MTQYNFKITSHDVILVTSSNYVI